jgi:hypothetical protein
MAEQSCRPTKIDVPKECLCMLYPAGVDSPMFKALKNTHLMNFGDFLTTLGQTPLLRQSATIKRHIDQLVHLQNLPYKYGDYTFFNSGSPQTLYIVQHGQQDKGKDVGRAYLIVNFGEMSDHEKRYYGFKYTDTRNGATVSHTGWRRLPSNRLVFHSDQFYSVLSTTYSTYARLQSYVDRNLMTPEEVSSAVLKIYYIRSLVGFAHRQRTAEFMSDFRYLYMDSFSEFSEVEEFILDKYTKPVQCELDLFLLSRIPKFDNMMREFRSGQVKIRPAEYTQRVRDPFSTGGTISLKSILHMGTPIFDIQDLLDDMFLYVHTNKEPSSPYHEFVNAVTTITEYQTKHDSHDRKTKTGDLTPEQFVTFLENDNKVGFWGKATKLCGMLLAQDLAGKNLDKKINTLVKNDTLLDMSSTRSIIPERKRVQKLNQLSTLNTEQREKTKKKTKALYDALDASEDIYFVSYDAVPSKTRNQLVILSGTNRCKVHDSTLDIVRHTDQHTTHELALWNIQQNSMRVVTDICIKAQYGAKREFYVINHGAKAMARTVELGYKEVCKGLSAEMISVKGDRKMYDIQRIVDQANIAESKKQNLLMYCNGDCTKWSAAETMECLAVFNDGLAPAIGREFAGHTEVVMEAWANKDVYVPPDLTKNIYFKTPGIQDLLKNGTLKSTQNFLQGMFNYMSSAKAVGVSELTKLVWARLFPDRPISVFHMEHSDDYALIVSCPDMETFEEFKLVHRIVMRSCGINDSTKKTNCQQFLFEFISLISFNGVMTYPHIKKVKETGLNIGAMGYASDISTTASRVGEACRVGLCMDVAYIMGRIQNARIGEAYGLFGSNDDLHDETISNVPTELWGLPDCYPIFYVLTKGDPNTLRLRQYGSDATKQMLDKLFYLKSKEKTLKDDESIDESALGFTKLFHPHYTYMVSTKLLKQIKLQLGYTLEDAKQYWDNHFMDLYLKPKDPERYNDWLSSKYFQHSFGEAYMRQGRAQLNLRISHFVRRACLTLNLNIEGTDQPMSIKEYCEFVKKLEIPKDFFDEPDYILMQELVEYSYDPAVLQIYQIFTNARIARSEISRMNTKAHNEPRKNYKYTCHNDPHRVLQYIDNQNDFFSDQVIVSNPELFLRDVDMCRGLLKRLGSQTDEPLHAFNKKSVVLEILQSSRSTGKPLLLRYQPNGELTHTIFNYMEYHTTANRRLIVETTLSEKLMASAYILDDDTQMYRPGPQLSDNWVMEQPELLGDLILTLFALRKCGKRQIQNIFETIYLRSNHKVTAIKYLNNMITLFGGATRTLGLELSHALVVLADVILDDPLPLAQFMKEKLSYTYHYERNRPWFNWTTVHFRFMGDLYYAIFDEDDVGQVQLYSTSAKLHVLGWAYSVALRLANQISVNELIRRFNLPSHTYLPECTVNMAKPGQQLYKNRITGKVVTLPDEKIDFKVPVLLVDEAPSSGTFLSDSLHSIAIVDLEKFSVYSGRAKVFTINLHKYSQVNCWSSTDTTIIPLALMLDKGRLRACILGAQFESSSTLADEVRRVQTRQQEQGAPTRLTIKNKHKTTDKAIIQSNKTMLERLLPRTFDRQLAESPFMDSVSQRNAMKELLSQRALSQSMVHTPWHTESPIANEDDLTTVRTLITSLTRFRSNRLTKEVINEMFQHYMLSEQTTIGDALMEDYNDKQISENSLALMKDADVFMVYVALTKALHASHVLKQDSFELPESHQGVAYWNRLFGDSSKSKQQIAPPAIVDLDAPRTQWLEKDIEDVHGPAPEINPHGCVRYMLASIDEDEVEGLEEYACSQCNAEVTTEKPEPSASGPFYDSEIIDVFEPGWLSAQNSHGCYQLLDSFKEEASDYMESAEEYECSSCMTPIADEIIQLQITQEQQEVPSIWYEACVDEVLDKSILTQPNDHGCVTVAPGCAIDDVDLEESAEEYICPVCSMPKETNETTEETSEKNESIVTWYEPDVVDVFEPNWVSTPNEHGCVSLLMEHVSEAEDYMDSASEYICSVCTKNVIALPAPSAEPERTVLSSFMPSKWYLPSAQNVYKHLEQVAENQHGCKVYKVLIYDPYMEHDDVMELMAEMTKHECSECNGAGGLLNVEMEETKAQEPEINETIPVIEPEKKSPHSVPRLYTRWGVMSDPNEIMAAILVIAKKLVSPSQYVGCIDDIRLAFADLQLSDEEIDEWCAISYSMQGPTPYHIKKLTDWFDDNLRMSLPSIAGNTGSVPFSVIAKYLRSRDMEDLVPAQGKLSEDLWELLKSLPSSTEPYNYGTEYEFVLNLDKFEAHQGQPDTMASGNEVSVKEMRTKDVDVEVLEYDQSTKIPQNVQKFDKEWAKWQQKLGEALFTGNLLQHMDNPAYKIVTYYDLLEEISHLEEGSLIRTALQAYAKTLGQVIQRVEKPVNCGKYWLAVAYLECTVYKKFSVLDREYEKKIPALAEVTGVKACRSSTKGKIDLFIPQNDNSIQDWKQDVKAQLHSKLGRDTLYRHFIEDQRRSDEVDDELGHLE